MSDSRLQVEPAKLVSSNTYSIPGKLLITELFFEVPLDHAKPQGQKIRLFCRSGEPNEKPAVPNTGKSTDELPWMVYIPGGPGFGAPSPQNLWNISRGYKVNLPSTVSFHAYGHAYQ
jgi:hypothetical protein